MLQPPADCLDEILQYLHDDAGALYSCLLVNRLWCERVVPILWCNPWQNRQLLIDRTPWPAIVRTLLSCLTKESNQILLKNGIEISQQISRPPLFNYIEYCQYLSPTVIDCMKRELVNDDNNNGLPKAYRENLVEQEFYKLFMARTCLKHLVLPRIPLSYCPGAEICLEKLRELRCHTDRSPELFYGLAQMSRNLLRISIYPCDRDNEGLIALIKLQKGLKSLVMESSEDHISSCPRMGQALSTQAHSLTHIKFRQSMCIAPTVLSKFINLRILQIDISTEIINKEQLTFTSIPKLEILDIFHDETTPFNIYISFIENIPPKFQRIYWNLICPPSCSAEIRRYIKALSLSHATLKFITLWWDEDCVEDLYGLIKSCHQLEAIRICSPRDDIHVMYNDGQSIREMDDALLLKGNQMFELLKNAAPKNLNILNLHIKWAFNSMELQNFLESWVGKKKISIYLPDESKLVLKCDMIFRRYHEKGILKDFQYIDALDSVDSLRDLWNF
ncbi:hypothetical protein C2G38_2126956 [Gigaspora rosea]|uniref:F-box domain-containing protein n=1 Tax=Gigaspora rosea TaxID=44941 RepID=A0A397TZ26_9GLOM|nr:hypothetical protein C2G38_2126956 [Gigaspora rosea]CAG8442509.1 3368_t:CDS:1 [Gigaspora rosea]